MSGAGFPSTSSLREVHSNHSAVRADGLTTGISGSSSSNNLSLETLKHELKALEAPVAELHFLQQEIYFQSDGGTANIRRSYSTQIDTIKQRIATLKQELKAMKSDYAEITQQQSKAAKVILSQFDSNADDLAKAHRKRTNVQAQLERFEQRLIEKRAELATLEKCEAPLKQQQQTHRVILNRSNELIKSIEEIQTILDDTNTLTINPDSLKEKLHAAGTQLALVKNDVERHFEKASTLKQFDAALRATILKQATQPESKTDEFGSELITHIGSALHSAASHSALRSVLGPSDILIGVFAAVTTFIAYQQTSSASALNQGNQAANPLETNSALLPAFNSAEHAFSEVISKANRFEQYAKTNPPGNNAYRIITSTGKIANFSQAFIRSLTELSNILASGTVPTHSIKNKAMRLMQQAQTFIASLKNFDIEYITQDDARVSMIGPFQEATNQLMHLLTNLATQPGESDETTLSRAYQAVKQWIPHIYIAAMSCVILYTAFSKITTYLANRHKIEFIRENTFESISHALAKPAIKQANANRLFYRLRSALSNISDSGLQSELKRSINHYSVDQQSAFNELSALIDKKISERSEFEHAVETTSVENSLSIYKQDKSALLDSIENLKRVINERNSQIGNTVRVVDKLQLRQRELKTELEHLHLNHEVADLQTQIANTSLSLEQALVDMDSLVTEKNYRIAEHQENLDKKRTHAFQLEQLIGKYGSAVEQQLLPKIEHLIEPKALERSINRHVSIDQSELFKRICSGVFRNRSGELVQTRITQEASTYFSVFHLLSAVIEAHEQIKAFPPSTNESEVSIAISHNRPVGSNVTISGDSPLTHTVFYSEATLRKHGLQWRVSHINPSSRPPES